MTKVPTSAPTAKATEGDGVAVTLTVFTADEYIVYSTVLIFAVVILVCGAMWCARPPKRAKTVLGDVESGASGGSSSSSSKVRVKKAKGSSSVVSTPSTGGFSISGEAAGGKKKSAAKKATKSPLQREADYIDEDADMASEASSLLGGGEATPAIVTTGGRSIPIPSTSGAGKSKGYKDLSPQDEALRKTFHSVLKEGMTMVLHTSEKNPKQIHLTLVGTELRWKAAKVFARNMYKIDLRDIKYVEWGKQTNTFQKQVSSAASDDQCFSLVTERVTVDLEASSKVERDALVQGFSLVVSGLRESSAML